MGDYIFIPLYLTLMWHNRWQKKLTMRPWNHSSENNSMSKGLMIIKSEQFPTVGKKNLLHK